MNLLHSLIQVLRLHENYHSDEARKAKEATPTVQKLQQVRAHLSHSFLLLCMPYMLLVSATQYWYMAYQQIVR